MKIVKMIWVKIVIILTDLSCKVKRHRIKLEKALGMIKEMPIVDLSEIGEKIAIFQEKQIEHFNIPKSYNFIENGHYDIDYPEIALWRIKNCSLFYNSDFVVSESGKVAWPKYFLYNYAINIPRDSYFVKEEKGMMLYRTPSKHIRFKAAFSMIGVHSTIWAHAIVEYLPKLSLLNKAIADSKERLTVVVPEYKDKQLKRIIYDNLSKYNIDIFELKMGTAIMSDVLYYMPRPTVFCDHCYSVLPGNQVIPSSVVNAIKELMIRPYMNNISKNEKYRKIFLQRRGGFGKGIINNGEIESIFKERGFYFLEPHKVSLEEKIEIFHSAEIVVGPFGSAFTNLFYCRPGTKAMIFSNNHRLFDYYFEAGEQYFDVKLLFVTGYDDKGAENMSHCSYYLPKEKVVEAAKKFGIFD